MWSLVCEIPEFRNISENNKMWKNQRNPDWRTHLIVGNKKQTGCS